MKVVALAGGVGGAKMAYGLAKALLPGDLTVVVNIGDDFDHLGLRICPDLDTVCYTLAGIANPDTGWGRVDETWNAMDSLADLGGPDWFRLGDHDLATHLERTRLLNEGFSLSEITHRFCQTWGVQTRVLPASDDPVPTLVQVEEGDLPFQEYFVQRQCQPKVKGFCFQGIENANPAPGVFRAIDEAQVVILCPSNPWVSIDPILNLPGVRARLIPGSKSDHRSVVGVSPLIGGRAVKGPAAKMYTEFGIPPSSLAVAQHYGAQAKGGLLNGFVLDVVDALQAGQIRAQEIQVLVTNTMMNSTNDRVRFAKEVLDFGQRMMPC